MLKSRTALLEEFEAAKKAANEAGVNVSDIVRLTGTTLFKKTRDINKRISEAKASKNKEEASNPQQPNVVSGPIASTPEERRKFLSDFRKQNQKGN